MLEWRLNDIRRGGLLGCKERSRDFCGAILSVNCKLKGSTVSTVKKTIEIRLYSDWTLPEQCWYKFFDIMI